VKKTGTNAGAQELSGLDLPKIGPTGRPVTEFPVPAPLKSHGPARIISLCNQKGGVGKTTTSVNLGAALAEYGRRVLAVDFDPQGALSAGLGVYTHDLPTIYDLLLGTVKDPAEAIQHTTVEGLDVIPANIDLSAAEVHLINEVARESILARVLRKVSDQYDVILIDCQPSLGLLTVNALTASHGVLIPLECEFFALRGVALLVETIDKVRDRLNPAIELDGILATMYDPRTLHSREVLQRVVETFDDKVFETVIGRTVKFPDATVAARPITQFAPEHQASKAYRQLARELVARGAVA
jgi:chromosome partitioning protein